jgi:hypothetical protein
MEILTLGTQKIGHQNLTIEESDALLSLCLNDEDQWDNSPFLAGVVTSQIALSDCDAILSLLKNKISVYARSQGMPLTFSLKKCWYNVMRPGDFNPLHDHSGDLSFIVTFEASQELREEQKQNDHPGQLWFYAPSFYGTIVGLKASTEGSNFYIFNSTLDHAVYPFRSETLRYSLAGNLVFN